MRKQYDNFFEVTRFALQQSSLLSIAKLIDPPFYNNNPKKPARFSIYYILSSLDTNDISEEFENLLDKDFIKSLKSIRRESIAHNNVEGERWILEGGVELLFELLVDTLEKIKNKNSFGSKAKIISLHEIASYSEAGVIKLFNILA